MRIFDHGIGRQLFVEGESDLAQAGGPGGGTEEQKSTAPPQFVPAEEFKLFQQTITQSLETLNEGIRAIAANRVAGNAPGPTHAEPDMTEEQYLEAIDNRDTKTIRRYQEQREAKLRATYIDPLQALGLDSIAGLTKEMTVRRMPHYEKYKKEIDGYIALLPAASKLNPEAHMIAYRAVVGQHVDEIVEESRQKTLREQSDPANAGRPGGTTGRDTGGGKGKVPTVEEKFGADASEALRSVGRDEEGFARRLGYKSWADYVAMTDKMEAEEADTK